MIQKISHFGKNFFYPTGEPDDVTTKITKMSPLFFFILFPHKKHFYEQNMLVTRLLERDYIWVLTILFYVITNSNNDTSSGNLKYV